MAGLRRGSPGGMDRRRAVSASGGVERISPTP
nr:MAG TPA: hypothetical protein [Caudoviricetes sp.]